MKNLQEALLKIREVGLKNTRIMPLPNTKRARIQIRDRSGWVTVLIVNNNIAEDVLNQAKSNLILG